MSQALIFDLTDSLSFEMIHVEGGSFMMGNNESEYADEKPEHEVYVDSFYLGKYPVTQAIWMEVMGLSESPAFFSGANKPIESVSWEEVQIFLQRLAERTEKNFQLPTEACWEYAARGGQQSQGYSYAGSNKLKEVAWYRDNSHGETQPVGQKLPNELGLYDMSGNVWEWCQDWFGNNYYEECAKQGVVHHPKGPKNR